MPKKRLKPKKPQNSGNQTYSTKQNRKVKIVAIWLILSLVLSLLVGALSFTPTPASASGLESVQITQDDDPIGGATFDTDGDGVENQLDPDIDGDGEINATDPDIDGDGIPNFDDGDPAETNGFDSNRPNRPGSKVIFGVTIADPDAFLWVGAIGVAVAALVLGLWAAEKRRKNSKKYLNSDTN